MNFLANQEAYLRATEYLKIEITKKGYTWNTEKMKPMDAELYANAKIGTSGVEAILDGGSTEVRGVTNFNGNKLIKERVFVGDAIAFGWVVADSSKEVHEVDYNYNTVPTYLRHANLVLKQKDEVVIKMPLGSISNSTGKSNDSVYRDLAAFALIEDESIIDFVIEFPNGAKFTPPAGKELFVSVYIKGLETFLKR